ncbi:MAG: hypothetical protein PHT16_02690 [Candidatus Pacebacteria bacterium]|nr:hypothetical protein [Candidatus Paceibacterota bacterium]
MKNISKNKQGGFLQIIILLIIVLLLMNYFHLTVSDILNYFNLTWAEIINWLKGAFDWFKSLFQSVVR